MKIESENMLERYAIVCSNYLHWKYDLLKKSSSVNNTNKTINIDRSISFLKQLNKTPHLMIYQIQGNYYENLFTNNLNQAEKIKKHLQELGVGILIKNWPN